MGSPSALEKALIRRAEQLGYARGTDRHRRYVYGTLATLKLQRKENDVRRVEQPQQ